MQQDLPGQMLLGIELPVRPAGADGRPENARCTPPGLGPEGETCRTCRHKVRVGNVKLILKCGLMRAHWTHGAATDIKARWAACGSWEPKGAK